MSFSVVGFLGHQPASALVVSVPGYGDFDIQVQETVFTDLNPTVSTTMPWWGSQSAANAFAAAVGPQLGELLFNVGPFFAWETSGPNVFSDVFCIGAPCFDVLGVGVGSANSVFSFDSNSPQTPPQNTARIPWATATQVPTTSSVPGPLPLLGAAAAFGWSRKLRGQLKARR